MHLFRTNTKYCDADRSGEECQCILAQHYTGITCISHLALVILSAKANTNIINNLNTTTYARQFHYDLSQSAIH